MLDGMVFHLPISFTLHFTVPSVVSEARRMGHGVVSKARRRKLGGDRRAELDREMKHHVNDTIPLRGHCRFLMEVFEKYEI